MTLEIPSVRPNDWTRLRIIIDKLKYLRLGIGSHPTFAGLTLTDLTASSLIGTNASKLLESVTIGTGLNYTRPTLSLSHLGIEDLTDPGADRIFFWDNSASTSKWLAAGNSIAITDVTIDTIQDIRTIASPTFAGLTITNACVLGSNSAVFQPTTDSTTFFQVLDADGGVPVFNVDTTNERVGIGTDAPGRIVSIVGVGNTYFQITNTAVGTSAGNGFEIFSLPDGSGGVLNREAGPLTIGSQDATTLSAVGNVRLNATGPGHVYMNPGSGLVVFQEGGTTTCFYQSDVADGEMRLAVKDVVGNLFILTNQVNSNRNHDHILQTNPTFYVHSDINPDTDNTQWISLTHDQTNAVIGWGKGVLEFPHTAPYLTLHNTTHEDTDGGRESRINFKGEQGIDPFEETTLARIEVSHDGTGADDKGQILFSTNDGSDGDTPTFAMSISSLQRVGIGTDFPSLKFDVKGLPNTSYDNCPLLMQVHTLEAYAAGMGAGISLGGEYGSVSTATFGYIAGLKENAVEGDISGKLVFGTNVEGLGGGDFTKMTILSSGNVGIGVTDPHSLLEVAGAISSGTSTFSTVGPTNNVDVSGINTLFLDTSSNSITIGGFANGVDGQVLHIARTSNANNAILEHNETGATQKIYLHAGSDETLGTEYGGWILVCHDGVDWHDCSHAKHVP